MAHVRGECHPCAYFWQKRDGCRNGDACEFCHLCDKDALKRYKREKRSRLKTQVPQPPWPIVVTSDAGSAGSGDDTSVESGLVRSTGHVFRTSAMMFPPPGLLPPPAGHQGGFCGLQQPLQPPQYYQYRQRLPRLLGTGARGEDVEDGFGVSRSLEPAWSKRAFDPRHHDFCQMYDGSRF